MNKQKILLGVLLVGLCFALLYAFWPTPVPEPGRKSGPASRGQGAAEKGRAPKGDLEQYVVQLDLLDRGVEAFGEPKRDLFQLSIPKPPPPKPKPVQRATPVAPRPVMPRPAVAPKPAVRLNVLGYLQTEKDSKVFLSSGKSLFVVKKGSRFGPGQAYYIEDLTADEVVIKLADRPVPIHLPLKMAAAKPPPAGFSPPPASPFRARPRAMPDRPVVPDDFMNDNGDDVPFEDGELDTDEAGDEGSPDKEGVHD